MLNGKVGTSIIAMLERVGAHSIVGTAAVMTTHESGQKKDPSRTAAIASLIPFSKELLGQSESSVVDDPGDLHGDPFGPVPPLVNVFTFPVLVIERASDIALVGKNALDNGLVPVLGSVLGSDTPLVQFLGNPVRVHLLEAQGEH